MCCSTWLSLQVWLACKWIHAVRMYGRCLRLCFLNNKTLTETSSQRTHIMTFATTTCRTAGLHPMALELHWVFSSMTQEERRLKLHGYGNVLFCYNSIFLVFPWRNLIFFIASCYLGLDSCHPNGCLGCVWHWDPQDLWSSFPSTETALWII